MCPVRAFAGWYKIVSQDYTITPSGYVFRKKMGRDGFSLNGADGMVRFSLRHPSI